jgi:hypothetical protein
MPGIRRNRLHSSAWLVLGWLLLPGLARAAEPFQPFVNGLRQQGLHEVALEYLAEVRNSPLLSASSRAVWSYEEGRTLIEMARAERDASLRTKHLEQARRDFEDFLKLNSAHPLSGSAALQLGNVIVERGRVDLEKSLRPSLAAQKDALCQQAREQFRQAQQVFVDAGVRFEQRLKSFPATIDPKHVKEIEARDQSRRDLIQAQLFAAAVSFEMAKTYAAGSAESKKLLEEAAEKYDQVYQAYRTRLAGLLARIKQGQCHQELGDTRRALGLYADILSQTDELEEFRQLKASALYLSMQCWLGDTDKKVELVVSKGEEWLKAARPSEDRQPDWLAVRYYTALAHKLYADSLKPGEAAKRTQELNVAKDYAQRVARMPGPFQDLAQTLVKQLTGADLQAQQPATFAEALERGRTALEAMSGKLAELKSPAVASDAQQVAALEQQARDLREQSQRYLRLALALRQPSTDVEDINTARYYLCYVEYQAGHYYDAALLGEFVARHYSSGVGARACAEIALASYLQTYNDPDLATLAARAFDRRKLIDLADYMGRRWPDDLETQKAWAMLIEVAVAEHDFDRARQCLAKIPDASPQRAEAELNLGQAYWNTYLAEQRKEGAERLPPDQIEALSQQARVLLEQGIKRMQARIEAGAPLTLDLVAAALATAQIYIGANQPAEALGLLEAPRIGPWILVKAKDPLIMERDFPIETCQAALRAYIGTQALEQAEAAMTELESWVSARGPDSSGELVKIYGSLSRGLEEQITMLRKAGKTDEMQNVSQQYETFLQRISQRQDGNSFGSLNWASETFFSLAAGYDTGADPLPNQARTYYEKALDIDRRILEAAAKDPAFALAPDALVATRLRTARCQRRFNRYAEALDLLESVLRARPQLLDAQTEAAYTYMDWAVENPLYYNLAIEGARTASDGPGQPAHLFWGWARLSVVVQSDPRFQNMFHEARWNLARCKVSKAAGKTGAERIELLRQAWYDIYLTERLKPELGSDAWRGRYDDLLKTIQQQLGEPPRGLEALEASPTRLVRFGARTN